MSRKHFNDFAAEISAMTDRKAAQIAADMVISVARRLNSRFDNVRFLTACGL